MISSVFDNSSRRLAIVIAFVITIAGALGAAANSGHAISRVSYRHR